MIADIFMKFTRKKYLDMKGEKKSDWTWSINFMMFSFEPGN